jgi:hypothetical protein
MCHPKVLALLPLVLTACTGSAAPSDFVPPAGGWTPRPVDVRIPPATPMPMPTGPSPSVSNPPSPFRPMLSATPSPARPVVPLTGGTLIALRDGKRVMAADTDRDRVWIADLDAATAVGVALAEGDQPGRLAEDGAGRVHVVLRGAGAIIGVDPAAGSAGERRSVCPAPRGIAYQSATDRLHVACAGGELVTLAAAGGPPLRTLHLDRDLRDVVVSGGALYATTFRSAELIAIDDNGGVAGRRKPPAALNLTRRRAAGPNPAATGFEPGVAWRTIARPGGGTLMLHQRGYTGEVAVEASTSGYGGPPCGGIVQSTVSALDAQGPIGASPAIAGALLAVDLALSPDGQRLALVAAGDARAPGLGSLIVTGPIAGFFEDTLTGCVSAEFEPALVTPMPLATEPAWNQVQGQLQRNRLFGEAVALAFDGRGEVVVQIREPAEIRVPARQIRIPLPGDRRVDVGYEVFHSNSGAGIACASCHPEGGEDGRVWAFTGIGGRRTQSLRGRVSQTAPLHWDGEMKDLGQIMHDVFTGRMAGPELTAEQTAAVARWIDEIPLIAPSPPANTAAVERGRALFASPAAGCAGCHAGPRYTNNLTVDVGTGRPFQVPSLTGLAARAPYLHQGCAATLAARFDTGCGGNQHGNTAGLSAEQRADLQSFLESL